MLSINWKDVAGILKLCIPQIVVIICALLAIVVCILVTRKKEKGFKKLIRGHAVICVVLAIVVAANTIAFGPLYTIISLATGNGKITEGMSDEAEALCNEIAAEGIVVLKNKNHALPLEASSKLNLFGWSSTNPIYGGSGSGSLSKAYRKVSFIDGLQNAGFEVNQELVDFYEQYRAERPLADTSSIDMTVPEPTMEEYEQADIFNKAKDYSNRAVIFIARNGGEGADFPKTMDKDDPAVLSSYGQPDKDMDYYNISENEDDLDPGRSLLELTVREQAMVDKVLSEFDDVTLVINAANTMELGWAEDNDKISSIVWCPGPGQTGFDALGKILSGEINPSGKTVDTFVRDLEKTPYYNNFGDFRFDNMEEFASPQEYFDIGGPSFVNYVEGIYVGYRYWETAFDEGLTETYSNVLYPFGYGLSYAEFSKTLDSVTNEDGVITATVTVKNTGSVSGKDIVELYYTPPYTNGGIEKSSVNLAGFVKTKELEPNESEELQVTFKLEDMASYDAKVNKAYVLEAGDYGISLRADAHNVIATETITVDDTIVYDENNKRSTDEEVATNKLDFAAGSFESLSRKDHFANYDAATAAPVNFSMPEEIKAVYENNSNYDPEKYNNDEDVMPVTGAKNHVMLEDVRGLDYDDPEWDLLMDELTVKEMNSLIARAGYQTTEIKSINKVRTVEADGPVAITNNFTEESTIGFPTEVTLSNTWNRELAYRFGQSMGKMADEMNISGWYGPAMNMHRAAFGGRNFEYYSEDPFIAGVMASDTVNGALEYGVYPMLKHFAFNDQEANSGWQLCTWVDEQTAREIYLKPFEMCVKNGKYCALMAANCQLGYMPAQACAPLLKDILRNEWGFRGWVITDWYSSKWYQDADRMIRNGADGMLASYDSDTNNVSDTTSATGVLAMRQASKDILYTVVNSRAYEPENLNPSMQNWVKGVIATDILILLLLGGWSFCLIRAYKKHKCQNNKEF